MSKHAAQTSRWTLEPWHPSRTVAEALGELGSSLPVRASQLAARRPRAPCSDTPRILGFLRLKHAAAACPGLLVVISSIVFSGCNPASQETGTAPVRTPGQPECRGLEDRLRRIMDSHDPGRFAQEQNIYYSQGLVRVTLELSAPDAGLPTGYEIQVEARAGNSVQALVQVRDLCNISNEPQVRSVMVPFEVKPKGG